MSRNWQNCAWIAAIFALSLGCAQSGDAANRSDPPGDDRKFVVQVGDKSVASPQPAVLNVTFDDATSPGMAELSWEVDEGTSLVVRVPYERLRAGRIEAELVSGPLAADGASANLRVDGSLVKSGTVALTLSRGKLSGGVEAESVSFEGVLAVSCAVPEAMLAAGAAPHVEEAEPGTARAEANPASAPIPDDARAKPVLIDDLRFRSAACARVKTDLQR